MNIIRGDVKRKRVSVEKGLVVFFPVLVIWCFLFCAVSNVSASVVGKIEIYGLQAIGKDELLYLLDVARRNP